mgnify:CR=1 FL=1|jgi:hypothetical protein
MYLNRNVIAESPVRSITGDTARVAVWLLWQLQQKEQSPGGQLAS